MPVFTLIITAAIRRAVSRAKTIRYLNVFILQFFSKTVLVINQFTLYKNSARFISSSFSMRLKSRIRNPTLAADWYQVRSRL